MASSSCPPQSQRSEPSTSPVTHCEWTRSSGTPWRGSPSTSASAVSAVRPPVATSRSKPIISNMPHLVGKRVDAIRHSAPVCAVALALFSCVDIRVDLIGASADLFGRDVGHRLGEIGWTLLEEGCECLLGFCGARSLAELLHFDSGGRSDLVDESPLDETFAGSQCAAWFCRELLRGFGCCREQIPVGHHAGHEAELRRPRGREALSQQE